jgi:DNA invertase Pin-like site-specific DNA recombinase
VFKEKVSGAKTDRAELAKLLHKIESGDVLVVTRLDRLARSTRDLLNVIAVLTERGAANGVKFGRPAALTPNQRQEAIQKLAQGEAQADVARTFSVSQATISRLAATTGVL